MAERKTATKSRGSKSSSRSRSGAKASAGAQAKSSGGRVRKRGNRSRSSSTDPAAQKQLAKAENAGKPMGRPPSEEPDVFLEVPKVRVGKIEVDVERLEAHLALRAQVANLVNLVAGVHVGVDRVRIDIEDVEAAALLKVRLQNTYNILDRTLTTIDEHPEILQSVLDTAGTAVEQVGETGREAVKPGGAVSELGSGVGDTLGNLSDTLGDTLGNVTQKVSPKRLASGSSRGASKAKSKASEESGGDGLVGKAAAGLAAGLLGGALYKAGKRPRVLGMPMGRKGGLDRVVKQIAKLGDQVGGRNEASIARKATERLLS
jgi:hypothetical protein